MLIQWFSSTSSTKKKCGPKSVSSLKLQLSYRNIRELKLQPLHNSRASASVEKWTEHFNVPVKLTFDLLEKILTSSFDPIRYVCEILLRLSYQLLRIWQNVFLWGHLDLWPLETDSWSVILESEWTFLSSLKKALLMCLWNILFITMEQTYGNPENIFPHKNVCYNHFQIDFSSPKTHQMSLT